MNLPQIWLKDYLDIDVTPEEFAEKMTMSGSKVEGFYSPASEISNVVVGRVESIEKHPDSDHLVTCQVNVGETTVQIVTGASNLKVGDLVPACLDGARLPGGKVIKAGKLRGVLSEGMMCSLGELGLTVADYPYAIADGIFVLEEDCKPGDDITKVLHLDTFVTEFEITSNRTDCYSILGLVREAAATFGKKANIPAPKKTGSGGNVKDYISVEVECPKLCPRYIARALTDVRIQPSPRWMRERLRLAGVRPINNIVDITNFVMLEYGQPLHAFDARYIPSKKILVRTANEGESITTLDGQERRLDPSMIVITDGAKPIAVAGIMGGENSEIRDDTQTVIFESANFDGATVRRGAKKIGLRTDASALFEKMLPAYQTQLAIDRACELAELIGAGKAVSGEVDVDNSASEKIDLRLDVERTNKFLSLDLPRSKMVEILESLEFKVALDNRITVPAYRTDIHNFNDVAEEIARIYGYNKIKPTQPKTLATKVNITPEYRTANELVDLMTSLGYDEILTYTFISPKLYKKIKLPEEQCRSVTILNPLGEDTSVMRTTTVPSLLLALSKNYNNRNADVALFEIAKAFYPDKDVNKLPVEKKYLTFGAYGDAQNFFAVKGIAEAVLKKLKIRNAVYRATEELAHMHPGRTADIMLGEERLGYIGQVHPETASEFEMNAPVYIGVLDFDMLVANRVDLENYKSLPKFPAVTRDIAVLCDMSLAAGEVENAIKIAGGKNLESCKLFDVYTGDKLPDGKKSLAYSLVLRNAERTLTDEDADKTVKKVLKLLSDLGCELRS